MIVYILPYLDLFLRPLIYLWTSPEFNSVQQQEYICIDVCVLNEWSAHELFKKEFRTAVFYTFWEKMKVVQKDSNTLSRHSSTITA